MSEDEEEDDERRKPGCLVREGGGVGMAASAGDIVEYFYVLYSVRSVAIVDARMNGL